MRAIILKDFGGVENLIITEQPIPVIKDKEVLIQVKAISINPVDIKSRKGNMVTGKPDDGKPIILGWDISGIVMESKSGLFKAGDEIFGMVNFPGYGNAYAEYVAAPADQLALKPNNISFKEAAAATLAALTAWQAFTKQAQLKAGQRVLIHAAAGGVGHYAVQLAKYLGAYVIGTASAANRDFVLNLGADEHIDYKKQPFEEVTGDIDFVLDTMGGDYIDRSLMVMKKAGTIVSIPAGAKEDVTEKAKAKGINGLFFNVKSSGSDMIRLAGLLEDNSIISIVSQTFNFEEMGKAHLQMESGRTKGKIVVLL